PSVQSPVRTPVKCAFQPNRRKCHCSLADIAIQFFLESVLYVGPDAHSVTQRGRQGLRPEVLRAARCAAQLERYEVVFFVMRGLGVGVAVLADLALLQSVRERGRRSNPLGPVLL